MSRKVKNNALDYKSITTVAASRYSITLDNVMLLEDNITAKEKQQPADENGFIPVGRDYPYKQLFYLTIFCAKGKIRTSLNMKEYEMEENDSLVCSVGTIISDFRITPDCTFFAIALSEDEFFKDGISPCFSVIRENLLKPQLIHNAPKQMEVALYEYNLLREIAVSEGFKFKLEAAKGIIYTLSTGLAQWFVSNPQKDHLSRHESLFMEFLRAVHANCQKERKIGFYAKMFGVTPKYFSKIIYDTSGRHAGDWIKEHVVLNAKTMLSAGDRSIQEISDALNFPNPSFFGKFFKAATGYSPKQYSSMGRKS